MRNRTAIAGPASRTAAPVPAPAPHAAPGRRGTAPRRAAPTRGRPSAPQPHRHGDRRLAREVEREGPRRPRASTTPRTGFAVGASASGGPAGTVGHSTRSIALVQPRHGVAGGGAHCLGVENSIALMPPSARATSWMPGSSNPRSCSGSRRDQAGQRRAPDAGEDRARVGQVRRRPHPPSRRRPPATPRRAPPRRRRPHPPARRSRGGAARRPTGRPRRPRCRRASRAVVRHAERVAHVVARHGRQHQRGVAHRARHRPGAGHADEGAGRP